jgi:hypothetical protein
MIKLILVLVLLCCGGLAFGQTPAFDYTGYKPIPKGYTNRDSLAMHIVADKPYTYWEYLLSVGTDLVLLNVIFSVGTKPRSVDFKRQNQGFYMGCPPGYCLWYIAYVRNHKTGYITTPSQFVHFIGKVDNLEEAILLCELNDNVSVDTDFKGAAYKKTKDGYDLVLMKYTQCPQTFEAIHYTVNGATVTKKENLGVYRTLEGCPIF